MEQDVETLSPQLTAIAAMPRPLRIVAVSHIQQAIDGLDVILRRQFQPPAREALQGKRLEKTLG